MRAVLDPNVLIAAVLSASGAPASLLRRWLDGEFELVVSPLLLAELARALAYPKIRARLPVADADALVELLTRTATVMNDHKAPTRRSRDPGDDYLLALAEAAAAVLVTGDRDLLDIAGVPVRSPLALLDELGSDRPREGAR